MLPDQRCQRPEVRGGQPVLPMGLGQDFLHHERIDVDHAVLQKVQRQHADLLVFAPVAGHLAPAGKIDKIVGAIPALDNVQALMDFATQRQAVQVPCKKARFRAKVQSW